MTNKLHKHRITKALVIPDIHIPNEDKVALAAVLDYTIHNGPWDYVIFLGDVLDFDYISNFATARGSAGQSILADYKRTNEIFNMFLFAAGPKSRGVWIQGNHDERVERYIDSHPELAGQLEPQKHIPLVASGRISFVPFQRTGESFQLGDAIFIHGNYVNEFHAKSHAINYGRNVFYGHLHDTQSYLKVWAGDSAIVGQSLGCLCRLNQPYMRGRPSKWVHAFGIFYFQPDGRFTYYVPLLFGGKFVGPDGNLYEGDSKNVGKL